MTHVVPTRRASDLIVRTSGVGADDIVVEIGPGLGSLTLELLATAARVIAVEVDPVLAEQLPKTVADRAPELVAKLELVHADALHIDEQIGRANVCTPVTNTHLVCSILLETK